MGCTYAKTIEFEQKTKRGRLRALFGRDHRRTKVQTIHIGDPVGVPVNEGTPMLNLARKTEQTVLMQLCAEGIIPNKGNGGVAFTIDMKEENSGPSILDEDYQQLPGVAQWARETKQKVLPRTNKLPPLTTRSVQNKMSLDRQESDVEMVKNEILRRKGKMARISEHRRELATAKRQARESERRSRFEEKMMKNALQKDCEIEKITVNDRSQRAKINREVKEEELRAKTEEKLARVSKTEKASKIHVSTEERLERARQKREKQLAEQREKWEKKERRIEEIKRRRRVNTPGASLPNIEA